MIAVACYASAGPSSGTDPPSWLHGIETSPGIRTVALTGELDMADSDALRQLLVKELPPHA
jgi:hypothetical protein